MERLSALRAVDTSSLLYYRFRKRVSVVDDRLRKS